MSYNPKQIPTPESATDELHNKLVQAITLHYIEILTPTLMITHRKGCYATVINSTYDNKPIEQLLGTNNAKILTEQVLNNISASFSTVPIK